MDPPADRLKGGGKGGRGFAPCVGRAGHCSVDDAGKAREVAEELQPGELEAAHGADRVSHGGVAEGRAGDDLIGAPSGELQGGACGGL